MCPNQTVPMSWEIMAFVPYTNGNHSRWVANSHGLVNQNHTPATARNAARAGNSRKLRRR